MATQHVFINSCDSEPEQQYSTSSKGIMSTVHRLQFAVFLSVAVTYTTCTVSRSIWAKDELHVMGQNCAWFLQRRRLARKIPNVQRNVFVSLPGARTVVQKRVMAKTVPPDYFWQPKVVLGLVLGKQKWWTTIAWLHATTVRYATCTWAEHGSHIVPKCKLQSCCCILLQLVLFD